MRALVIVPRRDLLLLFLRTQGLKDPQNSSCPTNLFDLANVVECVLELLKLPDGSFIGVDPISFLPVVVADGMPGHFEEEHTMAMESALVLLIWGEVSIAKSLDRHIYFGSWVILRETADCCLSAPHR